MTRFGYKNEHPHMLSGNHPATMSFLFTKGVHCVNSWLSMTDCYTVRIEGGSTALHWERQDYAHVHRRVQNISSCLAPQAFKTACGHRTAGGASYVSPSCAAASHAEDT